MPKIRFPPLPTWTEQLAGFLPLSTLLEFTNDAIKLHVFELCGLLPSWCWPVTVKGAQLLLSNDDTTDACCLDRPGANPILYCMDGKYGDNYPSTAAKTTRLYVNAKNIDSRIDNPCIQSVQNRARRHKLDIFLVRHLPSNVPQNWLFRKWTDLRGPTSMVYMAVTITGWLLWAACLVISVLGGLYMAMAYLCMMPLTGMCVNHRFGGPPRRLLEMDEPGNSDREVVATNSLNGSDWWCFYGPKVPVNGLLNRPLLRTQEVPHPRIFRWLMRLSIIAQWFLAVGSAVFQGWDAIMISMWIVVCSIFVTYIYPPERATSDWLRWHCGLELIRIRASFTSRRPMLGALIYINPDRKATDWLNLVLADCDERRDWLAALFEAIDQGQPSEKYKDEYWLKYVEQSLCMGKKIQAELEKWGVKSPGAEGC